MPNDSRVNRQMMTVMNTLCKTLTPSRAESETLSPMKRAELRSKYLQQLSELRQLLDQNILREEEYEEQRGDLVDSMRLQKIRNSILVKCNFYVSPYLSMVYR